MKFKKAIALARIFQGTKAQPPIIAANICPLLRLMYLGHSVIKSTAALIELAEMLVPIILTANAAEAKKTAARFVHCAKMSAGFQ